MNNFDKLYFTVKTNNNYIHKGSFNYKNGEVKKNGDISCSYNKMTFVDNKIQISYCEDIAYNVENKGNISYSTKTNETVLALYTFDELVNSEYWNPIIEKYKFDEKAFKRYEENYISEDKENIKYVSLDDDFSKEQYDKYGIGDCLVHTSFFCDDVSEGGLQQEHVYRAIEILNGE